MLPLDLHVLGLPLAFILSQDQTLHCISLNVCPTPGIPSPCIKMVHFLILRCRYNMYMNFFTFFFFQNSLSAPQKRPALSAKRVQIYAPYFLTAKCFSIFFFKKNQLIYKCLFFRFSFLFYLTNFMKRNSRPTQIGLQNRDMDNLVQSSNWVPKR